MSTSIRIDTSEWISGAILIGDTGGGVLGSDIPSSGTSGSGYAYHVLNLPTDAGKEICGRITTWPVGLTTFLPRENTEFDAAGPDGVYTFQFQLYKDYVASGSPETVTLTIGGGSVTVNGQTLTATASLLAGAATGQVNATVAGQVLTATANLLAGAASGVSNTSVPGQVLTVQATLLPGGAAGSGSVTVPGQTLSATASLIPGSASGSSPGNATVNGQTLTASVSLIPGTATGNGAATVAGQILTAIASLIAGRASGSTVRAPIGGGYPPRKRTSIRPKMFNTKR